jgi:hypothetical protein
MSATSGAAVITDVPVDSRLRGNDEFNDILELK